MAPAEALGTGSVDAQVVVGDPSALTAGDLVVKSVVESLAYTVELVDDDAPATADANLIGLIAIAPSTSGATIGAKYAPVAIPQVVFASSAWDSMGLTESDGIFSDSTALVWVDASAPVTAWLPSVVQVVPSIRPMRSMVVSNLADGATPVAVRQENTNQNVVFTFDAGDDLTTGAAPARRSVIGFSDAALSTLTADGTQLVTNLAGWAADGGDTLTSEAGQPWTPTLVSQSAAATCPVASVRVGCWNMNGADSSSTMIDTSVNSHDATISAGVARPGDGSNTTQYQFDGWKGKLDPADKTKLLAGATIVDAERIASVKLLGVTDPDPKKSMNPGEGGWRIKTRLKPDLVTISGTTQLPDRPTAATCPDTTCAQFHPSYNVVQKGRNTSNGGFYKIEIMGYSASNFQKGSVHCVYYDGTHTLEAYSGMSVLTPAVLIKNEIFYTIDCQLTRGATLSAPSSLELKVSPAGQAAETVTQTGTLGSVAPTNTGEKYGYWFAIGKKPDSTNPADSFRGKIDYVTLSTS